jgi:hypothetical protein
LRWLTKGHALVSVTRRFEEEEEEEEEEERVMTVVEKNIIYWFKWRTVERGWGHLKGTRL